MDQLEDKEEKKKGKNLLPDFPKNEWNISEIVEWKYLKSHVQAPKGY